jgi:WD40 repeat protein
MVNHSPSGLSTARASGEPLTGVLLRCTPGSILQTRTKPSTIVEPVHGHAALPADLFQRSIGGREAACPHGRHRLLCPRGKLDQPTIIHALPGLINAAAFSQDGREVVYGGSARKTDAGEYWKKWGQSLGYIAGWFWREAKPAFESAKTRTEPIDVAFHPENRTLAVACAGGEVIFLSRLNGSVMKVEKSKTTDPTTFLNQPKRWIRFSSSGRFLITGSRDWTIRLWDLNSSQLVRTFENQDEVDRCEILRERKMDYRRHPRWVWR